MVKVAYDQGNGEWHQVPFLRPQLTSAAMCQCSPGLPPAHQEP